MNKTKIIFSIISKIILFIFINVMFLVSIYRATRFKLNSITFLYLISLIILDLVFYFLPYKLQKVKKNKKI
jgi:preprotein translocase subunit YajC